MIYPHLRDPATMVDHMRTSFRYGLIVLVAFITVSAHDELHIFLQYSSREAPIIKGFENRYSDSLRASLCREVKRRSKGSSTSWTKMAGKKIRVYELDRFHLFSKSA